MHFAKEYAMAARNISLMLFDRVVKMNLPWT